MSRRRRRHLELNADINVVNLIDVMLLLLVIFMIAAPMMQNGLDVSLPKADARPVSSKSGMTITVQRDGRISVDQGSPLSYDEFRAAFQTLAKGRTQRGVDILADQDVPYRVVVQVLAVVQAAGVNPVGLIAAPEDH